MPISQWPKKKKKKFLELKKTQVGKESPVFKEWTAMPFVWCGFLMVATGQPSLHKQKQGRNCSRRESKSSGNTASLSPALGTLPLSHPCPALGALGTLPLSLPSPALCSPRRRGLVTTHQVCAREPHLGFAPQGTYLEGLETEKGPS